MTTPRMDIVWTVLANAKDAGDAKVVNACRRLIVANRRGWRTYAAAADKALVFAFA